MFWTVINFDRRCKILTFNFILTSFFFFLSKGRNTVTTGGSIQNFTIANITNIDDDPIFSISGDIAMNWNFSDNGVRIALTGGHFNDAVPNECSVDGMGIDLGLSEVPKGSRGKSPSEIEISNIKKCPITESDFSHKNIQGKNHGDHYKSGVVYGNYAIYVSNSTTKFPSNQNLKLKMKGGKFSFTIA